jgi:dGTPase
MFNKKQQLLKHEELVLAPYAMKSSKSLGRVHSQAEDDTRLPFQRDRDRIVHSKAFRRLQAKTQVFVSYYGDHYRDRLTHSMEVSQIARDICRTLGLNEDLGECLALAHDLGHPPFGHGGEAALDKILRRYGMHFEHNEQSRRIIEYLEKPYPKFDGLNVTKEVLDGLLKHHPHRYKTYIKFKETPHLESRVVDYSDQIAYLNHDVDDGLRAGLITVDELNKFKIWRDATANIIKKYKFDPKRMDAEDKRRFQNRIIGNMISQMIQDLCLTTAKNLKNKKIDSLEKVRSYQGLIVGFSQKMNREIKALHQFLLTNFYNSPKVSAQIKKGQDIITKLFSYYLKNPKKLPLPFATQIAVGERPVIVIKDYIAGMTDHFAEETWKKLKP